MKTAWSISTRRLPIGCPLVIDTEAKTVHLAEILVKGDFLKGGEQLPGFHPSVQPNELDPDDWPRLWKSACGQVEEGTLVRRYESEKLICDDCAKMLKKEHWQIAYTLMARLSEVCNDVNRELVDIVTAAVEREKAREEEGTISGGLSKQILKKARRASRAEARDGQLRITKPAKAT